MINPIEYINGTYMFKVIHSMNILNEHKEYLTKYISLGNVYKVIHISNFYHKKLLDIFKCIKVDLQNNYTKQLFDIYMKLIENIRNEVDTLLVLHEYTYNKLKDFNFYIDSYIININKLLCTINEQKWVSNKSLGSSSLVFPTYYFTKL